MNKTNLLKTIARMKEALIWCGGSASFAEDGIAFEGWKNIVKPLLDIDLESLAVSKELSGSEAIYAFCGWLTTQEQPTIMSAHHDSAVIAELIKTFCETNKLTTPNYSWENKIKYSPAVEKTYKRNGYEEEISLALKQLSGDFNYDNVAEAKKILKNLLGE